VGSTPLYGVHLWIVLALCVPLRLDAALAYLAANISIPPLIPFLLISEVEIGALARTGHRIAVTLADVRSRSFGELAKELAVGATIFAPSLGVFGGVVTWVVASVTQRAPASDYRQAIARVAARYARGRRAAAGYVRGKLASDPVTARVASVGSLGEVVDVGCGRGQLDVLLLEAARATHVHGIDWDAKKIEDARQAADGLGNARFEVGDVRVSAIAPCDTVLLIDVLHYMTAAEQDVVLARATEAARSRVLIRELDPDRGWRSAVTRAQEWITTGLGYNRGARSGASVRSIEGIAARLRAGGFAVSVEPCWGVTPFANVLIVAQRGDGGASLLPGSTAA
jgi:SAM-dependent methyltransferase